MELYKTDKLKWNHCLECKKDVDRIVRLGEEIHTVDLKIHSWTTHICKDCLEKALKLIKEE